jgi:predicted DNA-binding protein (MmcQ/YjbR family)
MRQFSSFEDFPGSPACFPAMNIDAIRRYRLSFPYTKEKLQWGETLSFKVKQKILALLTLDLADEKRLAFKCALEIFAELVERDGICPSP